jgi:hypothetical protein
MLSLAPLLAILINQSPQQSVRLVPLDESPYITNSRQGSTFSMPKVANSRLNDRAGIFLVQQETYDFKTYQNALKKLESLRLQFVVEKGLDGSLRAWDLDGQKVELHSNDVPSEILGKLKVGEPVVKMIQFAGKVGSARPELWPDFESHHSVEFEGDTMNFASWGFIGTPRSSSVNVMFTVYGTENVGSLDPVVGSEKKVDDTIFKIVSKGSTKGNQDQLRIIQPTSSTKGSYFMEIQVDWDRFRKENPTDKSGGSSYCYIPPEFGKDVPKGGVELLVSGSEPLKYWKTLSVKRHITILGYVGKIPTVPR